jgi:hypothetical protein
VESVVDGRFDPPRYLVREPLDYAAFVRCVGVLRDAGIVTASIAVGVGVREADVEQALKIGVRA